MVFTLQIYRKAQFTVKMEVENTDHYNKHLSIMTGQIINIISNVDSKAQPYYILLIEKRAHGGNIPTVIVNNKQSCQQCSQL